MGLSEKYKKSLESKWCLRLKTTWPDSEFHDGVVTHNRRRFLILREMDDLAFDGVTILPKRHIVGYRDGGIEECTNAILRASGALEEPHPFPWLDGVHTFPELFYELKEREFWPGVLMADEENDWTYLCIGPVVAANAHHVQILTYDARGRWRKTAWEEPYARIKAITLGDDYTSRFSKYILEHKAEELIEACDRCVREIREEEC